MADERRPNETATSPKSPRIPRPPSKEEVDQISEAQSMITDDWTGEAAKSPRTGDKLDAGSPIRRRREEKEWAKS